MHLDILADGRWSSASIPEPFAVGRCRDASPEKGGSVLGRIPSRIGFGVQADAAREMHVARKSDLAEEAAVARRLPIAARRFPEKRRGGSGGSGGGEEDTDDDDADDR